MRMKRAGWQMEMPEPMRMKRAGWQMEMPSRSTVFHPDAAASSRTSTRWSSRRFTSSTYRMPRFAFARRPGLERLGALGQGLLDVDRAADAVLGRAEGEVDHVDR